MTQVIRVGGSIGASQSRVVVEFKNHEQAKTYAKSMRKYLTPGEKSYYGMSYVVKKVK
jgi:hypothetical protein